MNKRVLFGFLVVFLAFILFISQFDGYYYKPADAISNIIKGDKNENLKSIKLVQVGNEKFGLLESDTNGFYVGFIDSKMIFGNKGWKGIGISSLSDNDYSVFGSQDNPKRIYVGLILIKDENNFKIDGKSPTYLNLTYNHDFVLWYVIKDKTASPPVITNS